ncbi:hypothetical protein PHYC_03610 [Phycisphaerales bacterium]|nr:hypothetical protein PHYC_03610 [Phycisphaerales bacterium]
MNDPDYPALWRSSNAASISCQRWFLVWVRVHLGLLGATGLIAAWNPIASATDRWVSGAVALTMFFALLTGLGLRVSKLDDTWFRARAFAENAKGAAWRFMTKPKPSTQPEDEAEEKNFLEELQQIRGRFPQMEKHLSAHDGDGAEITAKMREVRAMTVADRLTFYRQHRLMDQIQWYRAKAKVNAIAESRWFVAILAIEGLALVAAVVRMLSVHEYNPTGAVAAVAACFVAWVQTKRFSDLSNTYGVACRDLNGLNTKADHVHDEAQFQAFVNEVEVAVSREHRLWVERRSGGE